MITRGCFILSLLANCVLSLPVSHFEKEDVKVMKCIVEVIADALSKPHPLPVSQECLDSLRADERLISILRHQNFLKELQEIALQGASERANQQSMGMAKHVTGGPLDMEDSPDRSMLAFLERPGEGASTATKREQEEGSEERDAGSQEESETGGDGGKEVEKEEKTPGSHIPNSLRREEERKAIAEEGVERSGSEEVAEKEVLEEEGDAQDKRGSEINQTKEKKPPKEEAQEGLEKVQKERRAFGGSEKGKEGVEEEEEEKEGEDGKEHWGSKRAEAGEDGSEAEAFHLRSPQLLQEVPHHSKEDSGEEEVPRSPEALELQMMARREPEEGSASRKTEDHEIESLAAIESELESMAKKLHELRRG